MITNKRSVKASTRYRKASARYKRKRLIRKIIKVSIRLFMIFLVIFSLLSICEFAFKKAVDFVSNMVTTVDTVSKRKISTNVQASIKD
ncbi:hypothetical protein BD780_001188 [Clostridium tetanomorphum]|uniref:Uncharacterized protein n=1 Tax=Clostridium tetanomorphum TaxID=1553 RepID=A0A923E9V2_CLOTT|nr:hypothetical protein [Clostridium tetanomorphum]KAJ52377.1 hypothetical protein CTM_07761 [Clostridium tetanomorphum DSM 665]MBC2397897.1 hypothetical protein [Clostridium tetanomorphum]MBP1864787.1 hypothetical protein [Clostridium tetanomorphum]NRS83963.1 hypothetical protein [Clostridium tetanomorphum]NRZ97182.1 hypothetical protein [Clostridium tetanomorphum]